MSRLNIPLALPLTLFLASALAGVAIAYTPKPAAWDFFLYAAGIALYVFISWKRANEKFLTALVLLLGVGSMVLNAGFVFVQNSPIDLEIIQANNLAGILGVAIPLNAALAVRWARRGAKRKAIALGALIVFLLFGLLRTNSRGAWLALLFVGGVIAIGFFLRRVKLQRTALAIPALVIATCAIVLAAILVLNASPALLARAIGFLSAKQDEVPRLVLYNQVWRLIQDYFFTGSGLATFPMVYSTYALLFHVYFLPHAHNIALQIWMEQGLLGVIAFGWFVASFYWWVWKKRAEWNWLAVGGLAATTVMLLHGLFDAAFWYDDITRPLLFLPFALTLAGIRSNFSWKQDLKFGAAIGAASLVTLIVFWNSAVTRWYANLGSLNQTRIELSRYAYPQTLVEYVRHDADLSDAEKYFQRALELDPENVTANQRLAMIHLARGQYDNALLFAQAAYARDATSPLTWQLLGDAYLALGQTDKAFAYWSRVDNAANLLNVEAEIRYARNGDEVRAARARELARRVE